MSKVNKQGNSRTINQTKKEAQRPQTNPRIEFNHDQIAAKAYQIWKEKGCVNGKDRENWLEAVEALKRQSSRG